MIRDQWQVLGGDIESMIGVGLVVGDVGSAVGGSKYCGVSSR